MHKRKAIAIIASLALAVLLCPSLAMATSDSSLRAGEIQEAPLKTTADLPTDLADEGYVMLFDGEEGNWLQYYVDDKDATCTPIVELYYIGDGAFTRVPTELYTLKWQQQWYDESLGEEVRVDATPPFGVHDDGIGDYYEVTAFAVDGSGLTGQTETFTIFPADKHSFNYHAHYVFIEGASEAFVVPSWHNGFRVGYGADASVKVRNDAVNSDGAEIDPQFYTVTYYKRTPGPYELIVRDDDYDKKVWIEENPLDGFPTEPGTYFAKVEGNDPYYGSTIIDFDIEDTGYELAFDLDENLSVGSEQKVTVEMRMLKEGQDGYTLAENVQYRWYYDDDVFQVLDKNGEVVGGKVGQMVLTDACYGSAVDFTVKRISNLEGDIVLRADVLDAEGNSTWHEEEGQRVESDVPESLADETFDLFFDDERGWSKYNVDESGAVTPDVTLRYEKDGELVEVPEGCYTLKYFRSLGFDENGQELFEEATPPFGIAGSDSSEEGFAGYAVKAVANEGSGFSGETDLRYFEVADPYALTFIGCEVRFGERYRAQSTWSWHHYYRIPTSEAAAPEVFVGDTSHQEKLDPSHYTISYYDREKDPEYSKKENAKLAGLPTTAGKYYCVIEGISPYYGENYADFDLYDKWMRLWGANAFGTMVQAVNEGWKSSETVVIATFDGYWDALAASALAGSESAPVLLTAKDALSPETANLIGSLGASKAYICGGEAAVSKAVENEIVAMGLSVERFGGATAFNTAELISAKAKANLGPDCTKCVIATIDGFYDSLSMAPGSYALGMPVYLTGADHRLAASTVDAIRAAGYAGAVIVGGTSAVDASVAAQLTQAGISADAVERLGGANAWQTSELIAEWGLAHGLAADVVGVADGNGYWDALTGAPLVGLSGGPLVLVPHSGPNFDGSFDFAYDPYCIEHFVTDNAASIARGYVFGGEAAVSKTAFDALVSATS